MLLTIQQVEFLSINLATPVCVPCSFIPQCIACNDGPVCLSCASGYYRNTSLRNFNCQIQNILDVHHVQLFPIVFHVMPLVFQHIVRLVLQVSISITRNVNLSLIQPIINVFLAQMFQAAKLVYMDQNAKFVILIGILILEIVLNFH